MKTIVHIITGLNVGGAERALHTLLSGGVEGPFRNVVISLLDDGHYGPLLREVGIPVYALGLKQGRVSLPGMKQLKLVLAKENPDLLQGWMYHGNFFATIAQILFCRKAKLVWNIRTSLDAMNDMSRGSRAMISIGRWLSRRADAIIYNSKRSCLQHADLNFSSAQSTVLPNAFDLQIWQPSPKRRRLMRKALGCKDTDMILGYIGRDNIMKDPENLFSALRLTLSHNPTLKVIVTGLGLQAAAPEDIGVDPRVQFLGKRADIPELMLVFDVLCLSSRVEGFPNVIGEAMACGVPCVSTDVGDVRDIIGDTGWICPPRNSHALSAALDEALGTSATNLKERGLRARERISERYSHPAITDLYIDLYARCLGEKGTP